MTMILTMTVTTTNGFNVNAKIIKGNVIQRTSGKQLELYRGNWKDMKFPYFRSKSILFSL